jgi:hypothetical protein
MAWIKAETCSGLYVATKHVWTQLWGKVRYSYSSLHTQQDAFAQNKECKRNLGTVCGASCVHIERYQNVLRLEHKFSTNSLDGLDPPWGGGDGLDSFVSAWRRCSLWRMRSSWRTLRRLPLCGIWRTPWSVVIFHLLEGPTASSGFHISVCILEYTVVLLFHPEGRWTKFLRNVAAIYQTIRRRMSDPSNPLLFKSNLFRAFREVGCILLCYNNE